MPTELPRAFLIRLSADAKALKGRYACLTVKTNYKNDYCFTVGPSDERGEIYIPREEVMERAEETLKFALMDYGPIENVYKGDQEAHVLEKHDLERVLKAYERHQPEKQSEIAKFKEALLNWNELLGSAKVECQAVF
jgi:hypothetical protein